MEDKFYLTLLNQPDSPTGTNVTQELLSGDVTQFAVRFVNGLVHQGRYQTGVNRPIGETTALRIANELAGVAETLTGKPVNIDWLRFRAGISLE